MATNRSLAPPTPWADVVWAAPTSALRIEALAREAASMAGEAGGCPRVLTALSAALDQHVLPFGTDLYAELFREQARDGQWLAVFLLGRAQRKAEDSRRLGSMARETSDPAVRAALADLAGLDAEHARGALAVFDRAFPQALDPADRAALDQICPPRGTAIVAEGAAVDRSGALDLPDHLADLTVERLRSAALCLLLADQLPAWAAADARAGIADAMRDAAARELGTAGRLAILLEVATATRTAEDLAAWFGQRVGQLERLGVEEPIELLYALRFGQYP